MKQQRPNDTMLAKLKDTGLLLADPNQDVRGRKVVDLHGEEIGQVSSLFIDEDERKVRMLEIQAGGFLGFGDRQVLLPVDAITNVAKGEVRVSETRERVAGSPVYDPELVEAPTPQQYWEPFYGYYGLSPYWGNGYLYPTFPMSREETLLHDHAHHVSD